MDYLTTGRLAKEAGVKIDTVRYYEKRGLIPKPPRKDSGYRMFKEDTIKRIAFIKHAQEIGFSLHEIEELLFVRVNSKTTCSEVKKMTEAKIAEVESKILHLHRIKKALEKMVTICSANKRIGDCPILDMLDDEGASFLPEKGINDSVSPARTGKNGRSTVSCPACEKGARSGSGSVHVHAKEARGNSTSAKRK